MSMRVDARRNGGGVMPLPTTDTDMTFDDLPAPVQQAIEERLERHDIDPDAAEIYRRHRVERFAFLRDYHKRQPEFFQQRKERVQHWYRDRENDSVELVQMECIEAAEQCELFGEVAS